jgi:hypothetical protein
VPGARREPTRLGQNREIIFVNDGRTADLEEILDRLAEEDERVRSDYQPLKIDSLNNCVTLLRNGKNRIAVLEARELEGTLADSLDQDEDS